MFLLGFGQFLKQVRLVLFITRPRVLLTRAVLGPGMWGVLRTMLAKVYGVVFVASMTLRISSCRLGVT